MQALKIIAGKKAQSIIRDHGGLTADMVRIVLGASGGPKWLILRGLDDYIFGDWLVNSNTPKDMLGTSIGAMRMTLASTADPKQAFNDCIEAYLKFRYDKSGNADIWTRDMRQFFSQLFHQGRQQAILNNQQRRLNIIATRCRGIAGHPTSQALNILGMVKAYGFNRLSRQSLAKHFDRIIFNAPHSQLPVGGLKDMNMQKAALSADNMIDAIMASGSIPGIWHGIKDIKGAPKGMYRDGGITDYHFANSWDIDVKDQSHQIVLYPHFYSHITPGWFDKRIPSRRMTGKNWDHIVMLCPSDELVASLPHGKITDRKDFTDFSNEERISIWQQVIGQGYRMADEFEQLTNDGASLIDRMDLPE